jgi:ribosomal protein L37AE/L43A
MQDIVSPTCPFCQSNDVIFKAKAGEWECQSCDKRFIPLTDNSKYLSSKTEHP